MASESNLTRENQGSRPLSAIEVEEIAMSAYLSHVDACANGCRPLSDRRVPGTEAGAGEPCRIGGRLARLLERAQHARASAYRLVHSLAWRRALRGRIAVSACNGEPGPGSPSNFMLTDRPGDVTCRNCRALELLRDLWRMTPTIEAIGELLGAVDEELATPAPVVRS